jgi:dsRNA-specific ribonuclease
LSRVGIEQKKSPTKYLCRNCDKEYSVRSSLWYHERKCAIEKQIEQSPVKPPIYIELEKSPHLEIIHRLLSDNMELKNFIIEQSKVTVDAMNKMTKAIENSKPTVINQTNNQNNNNQKFNINVFLNEQCKDAMNFSDFIKGIEVSREDLENNAQLGFVGGISKIFLDNLRQLSVNERPIHCTDVKRETMYIKDDDKWTKETGHAKLNTAIQTMTQKSTRTLLDWKKVNPDYNNHDSEFSTRCIIIQRNSMAGCDRDTYYPKVIKAIAKEVAV